MEEDTAPPRRNNTLLLGGMGHMKLAYEVLQTSWMYGGAARPTSPLDTIIRSTPHTLWYSNGFIIMTEEEEEEKLARLE
jgi:hypothetical protein